MKDGRNLHIWIWPTLTVLFYFQLFYFSQRRKGGIFLAVVIAKSLPKHHPFSFTKISQSAVYVSAFYFFFPKLVPLLFFMYAKSFY